MSHRRRVSFWHFADKQTAFAFVAYWTNNGQVTTLGLNKYAANDPKQTCGQLIDRLASTRDERVLGSTCHDRGYVHVISELSSIAASAEALLPARLQT